MARGAALVTGASRRIGRAIALKLASAGFDIAVHYRSDPDRAQALVGEIQALGRQAAALAADLTDEAAARRLVSDAAKVFGPLTVLVNNASVFEDDRAGHLGRQTWDRHFDTNLRAPLVLAEAFAAQAGEGACIVNLLDQRVWKPTPQFFSYALSKSALWTATRMLAQAWAPKVRVNGVGPGPTAASIHQTQATFAAEAKGTLLGHAVEPDEIAQAVLYLVDAPSVTGQMIAVDSGQHLGWQTPDILEP
ncbi:SDR family oxidoreductase [Brevundimonas aveniformis]|uniref:SDR family oxidoreductase n=1 Tax=Brevundimonas aveniformis TaxID=370977 RepID=UPI002493897A|nr:SDR family oxidoreductase [Brevundimonas aveniformis]